MVRALASHARGRRFESYCLYQKRTLLCERCPFFVGDLANFSGRQKTCVALLHCAVRRVIMDKEVEYESKFGTPRPA